MTNTPTNNGLTSLDLFCGRGGFSLSMKRGVSRFGSPFH